MARTKKTQERTDANLCFENSLWGTAEKFSNFLDAVDYKHFKHGFIFQKYLSDTFEQNY